MQAYIDYLLGLSLDTWAEFGPDSPEARRADQRLGAFLRSIRDQG